MMDDRMSRAAYDEIRGKLAAAGYDHAIDGPILDLHGLAVVTTEPAPGEVRFNALDGNDRIAFIGDDGELPTFSGTLGSDGYLTIS